MLQSLVQDFRYAIRTFLKIPGFTLVAVLTLALGIGANAAFFNVINGILLEPLPYPDPDRIVLIRNTYGGGPSSNAVPDYMDRARDGSTLEAVAAIRRTDFNLTGRGSTAHVEGANVTASFFDVMGVDPLLGRAFTASEDQPGANDVVVLSHPTWQLYFGGDSNIVGQRIELDQQPYTVVGVMPEAFRAPMSEAEIWRPIALTPAQMDESNRGNEFLTNIGRFKEELTLQEVDAEMAMLAARAVDTGGRRRDFLINAQFSAEAVSLAEEIVGEARTPLLVLLGAVGMVLLIALANVANLLLSRASGRQREIFIRTALGAPRVRIIRQLLTESVLLASVGGALGLLLAYWGVRTFVGMGLEGIPRLGEVAVDPVVVAFAAGLSLLTGILFGFVPAWSTSGASQGSLQEGSRGSRSSGRGLRNTVVVMEVAMALILLVGAGLLVGSLRQLLEINPGFQPSGRLAFRLSLPNGAYPEPEQKSAFFDQLIERIEALPAGRSAGHTTLLPMGIRNDTATFHVEGYDLAAGADPLGAELRRISGSYIETMGIPLLRGRTFDRGDTYDSQLVVLVDSDTAEFFWPDEDPIGKRLRFGQSWREVVGVVGRVKNAGLDVDGQFQVYGPYAQEPENDMVVTIHGEGDVALLARSAQAEVAALDPALPIFDVRLVEDVVNESLAARRYSMMVLGGFGMTGLLLAGIGIYGVISYSVRQRSKELGIRIALGAQKNDVLRLVLGQGMALTLMGVAIGLMGAFWLTRFLESLLYGITATDPTTFATISAVLISTALLATYIPALRATRLDPVVTLRDE